MKRITILGETLAIGYSMAVSIEYERLSKKAFNFADLEMVENTMAWYYAVIKTYNKESKITLESLCMDAKAHDINALKDAVMGAFAEWCAVPGVDEEEQSKEEEDGARP
jgi:hypothetical protein